MTPTGRQQGLARSTRGDAIELDAGWLGNFVAELYSRDRVYAVVAVAWSLDGDGPVLAPCQVRTVVEPNVQIYVVPDALLSALRREVGSRVALKPGAARIWWPGVSRRSDPGEHPLVLPLEGESAEDVLAEFARQFHLSRPDVRSEIRQIEDREATRAETAEAELETVKRQLRAACGLAGVGRQLGLRALRADATEQASILQAFGENVAALRTRTGLSQLELSRRCFIRTAQISRLERGERVPSLLVLLVIAQALGVSVADLTADLPPLTRQAGRDHMRALITKTPRSRHRVWHLAQASGLPRPYANALLYYMAAFGEIAQDDSGYEMAQHPAGGAEG